MRCHIHMEQFATPDLRHDKDIEDAESKRYRDDEIAGHDGLGMVPNKGDPPLGGRTSTGTEILQPIGPHGSWGYANAKLES